MACDYIYNSIYQGKVSDYRRKHGTTAIQENSLKFGGLNVVLYSYCPFAVFIQFFFKTINTIFIILYKLCRIR